MMRLQFLCCLVGLSVLKCLAEDSVASDIGDDIDYEKLFNDPEIKNLLQDFNPQKNYSHWFHLDIAYGLHGNFHDLGCYWANAARQHFTFGDTYKTWHSSLKNAMNANKNDNNWWAFYEYFNFTQSLFGSSSFSLLPTWTWQIKDSHCFVSIGAFTERVNYEYSYDFTTYEMPQFKQLKTMDDACFTNDREYIKNSKQWKMIESIYKESDIYKDKTNNIYIDENIFNNDNFNDQYRVFIKDNRNVISYYKHSVLTYSNNEDAKNGYKRKEGEEKEIVKLAECKYKNSKNEEKKIYLKVIQSNRDKYDDSNHENEEDSITYVCNDKDRSSQTSLITNIFCIGPFVNFTWYQNKIDPYSGWSLGITASAGLQISWDKSRNFSFGKYIPANFNNIKIKRDINNNFSSFIQYDHENNFQLNPLYGLLQFEVGYNRITAWMRIYTPAFSGNNMNFNIIDDSMYPYVMAKYKDTGLLMQGINENNKYDDDASKKNLQKSADLGGWRFAFGIRINF